MEALTRTMIIAGCGPGSRLYLSLAVEQAVVSAKVLAGAQRLLELFPGSTATRLPFEGSMDAWLERLAARTEEPVVVLVSGDPGISSLAGRVLRRFGRANCRVIPGVSSVQLACGVLGIPWENAAILNAHASIPKTLPFGWSYRDPWVILMGARGAESFAAELAESEERSCFVCEDLSLPTERVALTPSHQLAQLPPHPRRIVILTRESCHE